MPRKQIAAGLKKLYMSDAADLCVQYSTVRITQLNSITDSNSYFFLRNSRDDHKTTFFDFHYVLNG